MTDERPMTQTANFSCPQCDRSGLVDSGDDGYQCLSCGERVREYAGGRHVEFRENSTATGDTDFHELAARRFM